MSYINDPREMSIRPESGITLEQDNRYEEMYHWGAMVIDLCGMPVEEYMKPMTVIVAGGSGNNSGDTPTVTIKEEVKIYLSIYKNDILISGEDVILTANEDSPTENIWKAQWEWIGNFPGKIRVSANINTENGEYLVSKDLVDNEDKVDFEIIKDVKGESLISFKNFGVGSVETPKEEIINPSYNEIIKEENYEYHYNYEVSTKEQFIYLSLKLLIDDVVKLKRDNLKYKDKIPFEEVNTEKEGYDFVGWVDSNGNLFNSTTMPSYNLTLKAKYEIKKCEVEFYYILDGTEEYVTGYTVNYNSKIPSIPSIKKTGYEFKGWEPSVSTSTIVKSNMKIYGIFESITYIVTWSGYTDGILTQEYKYGETLIEPVIPEKEGYTFIGWDKTIPEIVTTNLSFNAKFTINKYQITYHEIIDGIESKPLSSLTLTYNSSIPTKNKPVKSGYTYTDWKGYNSETEEEFNGVKMPSFNLKYITIRTTNEYILSYYDNNELIKEENYLYNTEVVPFVYEKEGWTVSEWEGLPTLMPYHNVSAYCTSFINTYEVKFVDQDGNKYIVEAQYGTLIEDIIPVIEGKTFILPEEYKGQIVGAEDIIINGNVSINEYKVVINVNGNTEEVNLPYGTNVEEYIKENYSAEEGYHMIINSSHETVPSDNSLVVEIIFEPNIWILSYQTNGLVDNIQGEKEVAFGTSILNELPEIDNIDGYDFNGWYNEGNKITESDLMPNNNLFVTGEYNIKTFNVIVKDNDVVILDTQYNYGTYFYDIINNTTLKSYLNELSILGYNTILKINGEEIDGDSILTNDTIIEIERVEKEYILTFMNDDIIISSNSVKLNTLIEYPIMENIIKDNIEYEFKWDSMSYNGEPMPNHDVTIRGSYQEKTEAPIYYGIFVTSSTTPSNLIFNEEDFKEFKSVPVVNCLDGEDIAVEKEADEYLLGDITDNEYDSYSQEHLYPSCIMIPVTVDTKYEMIVVLKADNKQKNFTSDKVEINIDGENYYLYTYLTQWPNMAAQDMKQK